MTIRLGYFEDFRGGNKVLLTLERTDVPGLRLALKSAVTKEEPLLIREMALLAKQRSARLIVCAATTLSRSDAQAFIWRLTAPACEDVDSKLGVLEDQDGHQYFDLEPAGTQIIVSVGEYDADWWARMGGVTEPGVEMSAEGG